MKRILNIGCAIAFWGVYMGMLTSCSLEPPTTAEQGEYLVEAAVYEGYYTSSISGDVLGTGVYKYGEEVTLKAVSKEGYEFDFWANDDEYDEGPGFFNPNGDNSGEFVRVKNYIINSDNEKNNPLTFTVKNHTRVRACFRKHQELNATVTFGTDTWKPTRMDILRWAGGSDYRISASTGSEYPNLYIFSTDDINGINYKESAGEEWVGLDVTFKETYSNYSQISFTINGTLYSLTDYKRGIPIEQARKKDIKVVAVDVPYAQEQVMDPY